MTDATIPQTRSAAVSERLLERTLLLLVAVAFLLKLHLVFVLNVNWDEFFYLAKVHSYLRGGLSTQLQTFHVHLFTWLRHVSSNEVDQVIAARIVVFVLSLTSAALTYYIARRFLDRCYALFALLCYLAISFTVEHGTSFRADPFGAVLFLSALALILPPVRSWLAPAAAGFAVALAIMVTIKALFYLPVIGFMLLLSLIPAESRGRALRDLLILVATLLTGFAALYLFHRTTLAAPEPSAAVGLAERSADKVIRLDNLFPGRLFFLRSLIEDAAVWVAFFLGIAALVARLRQGKREPRETYFLAFLLPLGTLLFYRNAFPYYYVFILSPAVVLCGFGLQYLLARSGSMHTGSASRNGLPLLAVGLVVAVFVSFGKHYIGNAPDRTSLQRQTVQLVHDLFPEPVSYIDRCSMISAYPKVGLFMSTWGMETYLGRGRSIFRRLLERRRPEFLLANIASLDLALDQESLRKVGRYTLTDEDFATLRDNFVHHWGQLYVAGKSLKFQPGAGYVTFEILIPGLYTLEANGAVLIDDQAVGRAGTLYLESGHHRAKPLAPDLQRATLRWGNNLYRPSQPPPDGPIFAGF